MPPADPRPALTGHAAAVYAQLTRQPAPPPTRAALAAACQLSAAALAAALDVLRAGGYITLTGETVQVIAPRMALTAPLPPAAVQVNLSIGKLEGNGAVHVLTGTNDPPTVRLGHSVHDVHADLKDTQQIALDHLPRLTAHPLRSAPPVPPSAPLNASSAAGRRAFQRRHELHFQLGLRDHRDVLPIPVLDGDVLGRAQTAQIHLHWDNWISSKHCEFEVRTDKTGGMMLYVRDCNSVNGTIIDHVPLEKNKWARLAPYTTLRVGVTVLVVLPVLWDKP